MQMGIKGHSISPFVATLSVFIIGLAVITYSLLSGAWYIFASICFFPFLLIMAIQALKNPFVGVCLLFTFNYFFIPWYRYTQGSGLSVWYDVATVTLLVTLLIYSYHQQGKIAWKYAKNILTFGGCIWAIYTAAEILNPTALTEAWVYSRGTIYNTLVVSLISVLTMTSYKRLRVIMLLLSIFTLTAVAKAIYQKYAGFDETETTMLIETEMYKTHLLSDVTRYFSFFTDAGNFGSNMGFATILFGISAIFMKKTLHQNLLCDYCHVCHICLVHFRHPRCIVCPHRRNHIVNFSQQKHQTYGSYSLLRIVFLCFFRPYLYR